MSLSLAAGLPARAANVTRYTVEHHGDCILIYGAVPMSAFAVLAKLAPGKSVMSSHVARLAGSTFAFGLSKDLDALKKTLEPAALARVADRYRHLSSALQEWLAWGEHGTSSLTMFSRLAGVNVLNDGQSDVPHDADDLSRCRRLLDACPELAPLLPGMADVSPAWARLIARWDELCTLMDIEGPAWRISLPSTPRTNALLNQLNSTNDNTD